MSAVVVQTQQNLLSYSHFQFFLDDVDVLTLSVQTIATIGAKQGIF